MKYLIDTHIMLWWLANPKKLSKQSQTAIADRSNEIYTSSVSFWELAIKNSIGRIEIPRNLMKLLEDQNINLLPLQAEEVLSVVDLPDIHKDPFDRMLIAQAKYNNFVFITRDKDVLKYPIVSLKG